MPNQLHSTIGCPAPEPAASAKIRLALAICTGGVLLAGCSVNVGGRQRPLLQNEEIKGELELVAERRTDEQGTSGDKRKSTTEIFEERVRLSTEGDVYHPDFLSFTAAVGVGLAQQEIDSDDESGSSSETLDDYNIFAQLLRGKIYPTTFNASRAQELIGRQFLGALRTEREDRGITFSLRPEDWPMTFQYTESETGQDGLSSLSRDFFERDDERFRYSLTHDFSRLSHMSFDFDRTEVSQRSVGSTIETDTDRYAMLHNLIFGSDEQNRLDSFFNYVDQSGSFDFQNLQAQERLRLQHSDTFLTNYELRFTDSDRATIRNKEVRGQGGFEHRLYESLVTTSNIFVSRTDLDAQGDLDQQGGMLGFNYRKKNDWGTLYGNYTASLTQSEQSGGSGTGVVIDESHIFTDPLAVTLNRVNIDTSTIVVTDGTGLNIYTEGDDYTITEINGRVQLNITTLGVAPPNVTDGQEILVDYNFFIEPKREEDTTRHNFNIRQRFKNGLSVYYAHRRQDEDVSSTITEITPDEFKINTAGADYMNKGLFLQAEYSDEESTQIPSTSKKLVGRYSWSLSPGTTASLRVLNHWLDFGQPDKRDIVLFKSGAELYSRLTEECGLSARADYRNEDDTRFGKTEGFQLNSELQYNFRQMSVTTGLELNLLNRRSDEIDGSFLYFKLKRFF
ncbi:MAG: hypothetical protein AMJ65_07610 [Phycisphaerae bacterium SG8_4]|nr:MAG: hypothetical protein AMJ65_07610 [Phycisphaerae bacterium SG8_4]